MSILKKNETSSRPAQLSLLYLNGSAEGQMADITLALRASLVKAIKQCSLSRYQIAAQISELISRDITKEMLDKYCAESAEAHRIPAEIIPAFCLITGSRAALDLLAQAIGCTLLGPEEAQALEIVRLRMEKTELEKQIKKLEKKARR